MCMNNILYAQIGNAVQLGIFNALTLRMSLKDSIKDAQYMFKYSSKKSGKKNIEQIFFQIESLIKKGFYEFSNLGKIKTYQKIHTNKKTGKVSRYDFEFCGNKKNKFGLIVELKCTWKNPDRISQKIIRQMLKYKKNTLKKCMICFLKVNLSPSKSYVNTVPYWYFINNPKKEAKRAA